jgi:hypothetical protein
VKTPAKSVTPTLAEAESAALATLVAVTVCVPALAGGVYRPFVEIVPTEASPFGTPSTLQFTLEPLVTHAVNCWVCVVTTTAAARGERLTGTSVKPAPALATPFTVTTTLPVVAPAGTGTEIKPALQLEGVAAAPLNVTVLVPWVAPKFVPAIVTGAPTAAEAGDRIPMPGVGTTVNTAPALATLFTVTTTLPLVAPAGTGATIDVALQEVGAAAVPLNVTVLVPWVAPKFVPMIVTAAPTGAEGGDRLRMLGVCNTVNSTPALTKPFTVTTTLPVVAPAGTGATIEVALQLVGVAAVPLNVTVLVPWVAPKFVPVIVTTVPTTLDVSDRLVMFGGGGGGGGGAVLLPHPANPNIAARAIPRQQIPALLPTFALLT